ncbi:MAG: acyl-CoA/acyl-ACP dehydrogenase [Candidatus Dormibacteraeota bacterium]|nr:acyl-CoA/acyl-ACP dehydrogenase [Candidatus Dormibacteraeota bacterium]
MDFAPDQFQAALRDEVRALCERFPPEYWLQHDQRAEYPWEFVRAFAERGWLGLIIPEAYGGAGLGVTEAGVLLEAVCASGAGLSGAAPIHFYFFPLTPVIRHGSEAMKQAVLPRLASGELIAAFGVTEPNAGSDTSRITTRAMRGDEGWLVSGQKVWTTNAQNAHRILLLARDQARDPADPYAGMTLFFTDFDRDRITVRRIEKLGREAVDSNEIFIDSLRIPDADVVGEVGRGFRHLLDGLNPERIVVAFEAVGIGRATLRIAAAHARERIVFDRPIGANQAIAHPLAQAWAKLEAAELMAFKAAWLYDHGQPCASVANAAKLLAADAGFEAADAALQTLGGFGYAKEYHVERLWREVRLYKIAPVSQQMVLNYLAQHVLELPKSY